MCTAEDSCCNYIAQLQNTITCSNTPEELRLAIAMCYCQLLHVMQLNPSLLKRCQAQTVEALSVIFASQCTYILVVPTCLPIYRFSGPSDRSKKKPGNTLHRTHLPEEDAVVVALFSSCCHGDHKPPLAWHKLLCQV